MTDNSSTKPIELLLIEDNPGDALLIEEMLSEVKGFPFTFDHVPRLSEGLERMASGTVGVALLDLSLPDSHGLETVARARAQSPGVPIVVMTGLDDEETGIAAVKMGAQDFLVKRQLDGNLLVRSLRYAVERKRAEEQARRHQEHITALHEIERAITSTLDLHSLLSILLEKIDQLLPYPATTVRLWNKESACLEPVACRNLHEESWKLIARESGRGVTSLVLEKKAPVTIKNVQRDPCVRNPDFCRQHNLVSYLEVPLIVKEELLGVLGFYTREEHDFSKEEIEFLSTVAGQAAVAIQNSQLYQQTRDQAIELERADRIKNEFLSVVSHELCTPVNVIMGYTKMVKDGMMGELNPEQDRALGKVSVCAKDLLAMINDILRVTMIESHGLSVVRTKFNMSVLVDVLRASCEIPPGKKEVTLHWDCPAKLPVINTDNEKLAQILQNLINNAIKFTEKGLITVSVRPLPQEESVEFTVHDSGIGIPNEILATVFDKFHQADSSSTRNHNGVGLGLYIAKKLTELLGGSITVQSELGKGSAFTVRLPCMGGDKDTALIADSIH